MFLKITRLAFLTALGALKCDIFIGIQFNHNKLEIFTGGSCQITSYVERIKETYLILHQTILLAQTIKPFYFKSQEILLF